MAAMAVTHTAHAMKSSSARFNARSTTDTLRAHVALANPNGALAPDAAFTMSALRMSVLGMQRGLVRPVRVADDPAEVEPVVVRNFAPAFAGLVHCYDIVEALAGRISQQVRVLQFAIAKPRIRPFGLQRVDGNAGLVRNSRQDICARNSDAEHQEECRYD